jgi:hypothetical protein
MPPCLEGPPGKWLLDLAAGISVPAVVRACGAGQVIDQLPMFPGGLGAENSIRSTAWP